MGYQTHYSLKAEPWPEGLSEAIEAGKETQYALEPDGSFRDSSKWYDHEQDMIDLSCRFPHVHFILRGHGSNFLDSWEKHFKNGLMQVCKSVLLPFDPKSLG